MNLIYHVSKTLTTGWMIPSRTNYVVLKKDGEMCYLNIIYFADFGTLFFSEKIKMRYFLYMMKR
jgi:hypothetical protein